jgi:CheY-like chemotaxis protein
MQSSVTKHRLLLVDGDPKSLRVLDVSLKKAGFQVITATNGLEALSALESAPDLIISDTHMPEMDGFELCRRIKQRPEWAKIPFIFLSSRKSIEEKIRGLELGVEDYLTKPIYIKEIVTRVRMLLQRAQRERLESRRDNRTKFAGQLWDIGVVDLIQTIEINRKSGIIHIVNRDGRRGAIYFRDGQVIDAEAGRLSGSEAIYRMFAWAEGSFEVEFKPIRRKDTIELSPQALLMEGMRRLDEWTRLVESMPSMDAVFEVDYHLLAEKLAELPDEVNNILRLFDGRRGLFQVIEDCDFPDLEALTIIGKLYGDRLIREIKVEARAGAEAQGTGRLERWLNEPSHPGVRADAYRSPVESAPTAEPPPPPEPRLEPRPEPRREARSEPLPPPLPEPRPPGGGDIIPFPAMTAEQPPLAAPAPGPHPDKGRVVAQGDRVTVPVRPLEEPLSSPASTGALGSALSDAASSREMAEFDRGARTTSPGHAPAQPTGWVPPPRPEPPRPEPPRVESPRAEPPRAEPATTTTAPPAASRAEGTAPAKSTRSTAYGAGNPFDTQEDTLLNAMATARRRQGLRLGAAATVVTVLLGVAIVRMTSRSKPAAPPAPAPVATAPAPTPPTPPPAAAPTPAAPTPAAPTPPAATAPAPTPAAPPPVALPSVPGAPPAATKAMPPTPAPPAEEPAASPTKAAPAAAAAPAGAADELRASCLKAHNQGRGKYRAVVAACQPVVDADPKAADVMTILANAEFDRSHFKEARTWAQKALEIDPTIADAYAFVGAAEQEAGRKDEARAAYEKYLELAPDGRLARDVRDILKNDLK